MGKVKQYFNDLEDSRVLVEQVEKFIKNFNLATELYDNNGCTPKQLIELLEEQYDQIVKFVKENKTRICNNEKVLNRTNILKEDIKNYCIDAFRIMKKDQF